MCLDILRWIRALFYFLSKRRHKYTERGNVIFPVAPPDILGNESVCQNLPDISGKEAEKLVFNRGQVKFLLIQICAAGSIVNAQSAVYKNRRFCRWIIFDHGQTSLYDTKSCQKLFYRKWFGQIIVGSCIQSVNFVRILTAGADNNNRHGGPGTDSADHFHSVNIRQTEIQKNNIRIVGGRFKNGSFSVSGYQITIVVCFQCGCDQIFYRRIIFHY